MIFAATLLSGVVKIEMEPTEDERGFFARTFCAEDFTAQGLPGSFAQSSLSRNARAGTLRGMHFQSGSRAEAKLVRCTRGRVFDVVVDLRPASKTYRHWIGEILSADNGVALFIPPGFAHGFQTLEDVSDVSYAITPAYQPGFDEGVRWNDPAFGIVWPREPTAISQRDSAYPDVSS